MSASRPYRSIITRLSTALTFCANRKPANKAEKDEPKKTAQITEPRNEAGRRLYRCPGGGDLGACVCRKPDRTRRIFAGADDDAALCDRRDLLPVVHQRLCRAVPGIADRHADRRHRRHASGKASAGVAEDRVKGDRCRTRCWLP